VASSNNLPEIKQVVEKIGLNPQLLNKKINFGFRQPWQLTADLLAQTVFPPDCSGNEAKEKNLKNLQSSFWCVH
jgi:hypothetical protein